MAKYTKTRFLKYFNRPIVIVAIEIDTIGIFFAITFGLFLALSLSSILSPYLSFMTSATLAFVGSYFYVKYKNEAPKGFLKHLLYVKHIYKVKEKDFKEEVKKMDIDVEKYYPNAIEKLFID